MSVTDDQARAITYLAAACRPKGAPRWDEQGIYAQVMKIADRNLPMVIEHVIRHASDAKARTPGVIAGNFTPPAPIVAPELVRNPRRGEDCPTHPGQWPSNCAGCATDGREAVYDDTTDTTPFRDAKAAAFAAARQARGALPLPTEEDATEETP